MRQAILIYVAALALLVPGTCQASLDRLLSRRQSGESEQESTTPKPPPESTAQQKPGPVQGETGNGAATQQGRLYPDLALRPEVSFLPPFNAPPQPNGHMPPFVPFNMPNRLNSDQQNSGPFGPRLLPPARPMTAAERAQSQSFTSGLGKRLLSLIGVNLEDGPANNTNAAASMGGPQSRSSEMEPPQLGALLNSTVLAELNKRLNSLMGGLSKMYNSTAQEQLVMLQERFKRETGANNTTAWQQRVAEQVPMFFKLMVARVSNAQEHLNRVMQDLAQAAQGNRSVLARLNPNQQRSFFSGLEQFMNNPNGGGLFGNTAGEDFAGQISRSLGLGGAGNNNNFNSTQLQRMREFWVQQVQPQIGMLRNQIGRAWRDLSTSGLLTPNMINRWRARPANGANNGNNSDSQPPSNELVDSLLKEAESEMAEFSLVAPKSAAQMAAQPEGDSSAPPSDTGGQAGSASGAPRLSPQMQQRLAAMQRDLNHLWQGLTSSLQNAVGNVRNTLNPQSRSGFGPFQLQQQPQQPAESDPQQNEIGSKVQDLAKLQNEADVVYDTVQQRQREQQQRLAPNFADRFRGFINNVDMSGLNQLPDRIGDQFQRFSTAVGNFWVTIPERLDNLMSQRRNQENQAKLRAQLDAKTSTAPPAAAAPAGENPE